MISYTVRKAKSNYHSICSYYFEPKIYIYKTSKYTTMLSKVTLANIHTFKFYHAQH